MSRKKSSKKRQMPVRLTRLFKMTPEQLATRKRSGGGIHKSGPKHKTRAVQKRHAIEDQAQA